MRARTDVARRPQKRYCTMLPHYNLHRITDTLSLRLSLGPRRAFTAAVMTSSLATLVNNLSSLAKSAVDAAVQPGADPAPKMIDSVSFPA